jgi:hypothetical protein
VETKNLHREKNCPRKIGQQRLSQAEKKKSLGDTVCELLGCGMGLGTE